MLGGLAAGLALSPLAEGAGGGADLIAVAGGLLLGWLARPRHPAAVTPWLATLAVACTGAGLLLGAARLRSIDAGALMAAPGARLDLPGYVAAVPRRSHGVVRVEIETPRGRLAVEAPEPVPDLTIGAEVRASGVVTEPPPWLRGYLRLHGVSRILRASRIELTGSRRGGVRGRVDLIRARAEAALGRGMPEVEAALARGFVLGEDDRIPADTRTDFQRSGLAHHLAVSGENVVLLAVLATPLLAALAIPLRARLLWLLALIGLYVPLAGGGASIQRAGVMGAAAVVATLAGRPASRAYALLLAAATTLALNPRASSDVGWQLSFAAVVGIFVFAAPLRDLFLGRPGGSGWRRALAEGVAVTVAATLATFPLMAHHFEAVSVTSLAANVLALPAVAPAMWLGMVVAGLGQLPGIPVEPLNWLNSLLLAYVAQIAAWMGGPRWALAGFPMASWTGVLAAYTLILAAGLALRRWAAARRGLGAAGCGVRMTGRRFRPLWIVIGLAALALLGLPALVERTGAPAPPAGLRVTVLDIGQGDSILLQPPDGAAVLVDGGPHGDDLRDKLDRLGVDRLAAAVVTHDQVDHAGGVEDLLGSLPIHASSMQSLAAG